MNRALALALLAPLLAGCPSSSGLSAKAVIPGAIAAGVKRAAGEAEEPLLVGASWKAGDRYYVEVTSEADAHLYLVLLMESGAQRVVAPAEEGKTLVLRSGEPMRVPLAGWATVEGACPGTDRLFVVASQRPLTIADTVLFNAIDRIRRFDVVGETCGEPQAGEDAYGAVETEPAEPAAESAAESEAGSGPTGEPAGETAAGEPLDPTTAPPPPPRPPAGAGLAADLSLFADRAACLGRPECTGKRELKSQGSSYVSPFDELGVAIMELSFAHE